ncbi:hypothetical protein MC7420_8028 [Coleofasciculus chthonoplastes PCC 7420]|uniref:Uncharacterized protein n=1 Tax=Coleofasciculus chthonoplastes PCC 7420 TaxID=118168 RepID=B4VJ71_9CYAN|nr:hypothetical protein [Coleofasciculus chthonoplastes]EDX78290.1 hypothetical protein MC7420_8028 [Coleofasciculus chthonoplastes PCC 7420]
MRGVNPRSIFNLSLKVKIADGSVVTLQQLGLGVVLNLRDRATQSPT